MASSKPKSIRGSVPRELSRKPAPDAGWRMLKNSKASKPELEPAPAESEQVVVRIVVGFTLNGLPIPMPPVVMQTAMPRLPADQDAMQIQLGLDARLLMQMLEPHVGPSNASVVAPKPGLWVPGRS